MKVRNPLKRQKKAGPTLKERLDEILETLDEVQITLDQIEGEMKGAVALSFGYCEEEGWHRGCLKLEPRYRHQEAYHVHHLNWLGRERNG